jgi:phage terminase small subunit
VTAEYELEQHHLKLLQLAAEAWDTGQEARKSLVSAGSMVFLDRFGQLKAHPAVAIERDAGSSFARLLRELALHDAPEPESRPPRRYD